MCPGNIAIPEAKLGRRGSARPTARKQGRNAPRPPTLKENDWKISENNMKINDLRDFARWLLLIRVAHAPSRAAGRALATRIHLCQEFSSVRPAFRCETHKTLWLNLPEFPGRSSRTNLTISGWSRRIVLSHGTGPPSRPPGSQIWPASALPRRRLSGTGRLPSRFPLCKMSKSQRPSACPCHTTTVKRECNVNYLFLNIPFPSETGSLPISFSRA
jgi:hypothetical protein